MKVSYTPEQRKRALATYRKTRSYVKTIRQLGYPSYHTLIDWVKGVKRGRPAENAPHAPRHYPWRIKRRAVDMMLAGENKDDIARTLGIHCSQQIYKWVRIWRERGDEGLMSKRERGETPPRVTKRQLLESLPADPDELRELAVKLMLEKAVLEKELELSKPLGASSRENCQ